VLSLPSVYIKLMGLRDDSREAKKLMAYQDPEYNNKEDDDAGGLIASESKQLLRTRRKNNSNNSTCSSDNHDSGHDGRGGEGEENAT